MTTSLGNYTVGDPVILTNANKLGKYGLRKGTLGNCNAIQHVDGKKYVLFMPSYTREMFWIEADRCILNEEALENELPKPPEDDDAMSD